MCPTRFGKSWAGWGSFLWFHEARVLSGIEVTSGRKLTIVKCNVTLYTLIMNLQVISEKMLLLDAYRPHSEELTQSTEGAFRLEFTWASNSLEGNSLTLDEVRLVLEKGLTVDSKPLMDHLRIVNHAKAIDWIYGLVHGGRKRIIEKDLIKINEILLRGIEDENAGKYRVSPPKSCLSEEAPDYRKIPDFISDMVSPAEIAHHSHPLETAVWIHQRLHWISPFSSVNGLTARLVMNLQLLLEGYPPASFGEHRRGAYLHSQVENSQGESYEAQLRLIAEDVEEALDRILEKLDGNSNSLGWASLDLLRIGKLGKLAGESPPTIRHWVKSGLMEVAKTTDSGYQLFDPSMLQRAIAIRKLQKERLTLDEIKMKLLT